MIEKTIDLLSRLKTQEDQLHHVFHLRGLKEGWTIDQRKAYFGWFDKAARYKGGASFAGYVANARAEALSTLTPEERRQIK